MKNGFKVLVILILSLSGLQSHAEYNITKVASVNVITNPLIIDEGCYMQYKGVVVTDTNQTIYFRQPIGDFKSAWDCFAKVRNFLDTIEQAKQKTGIVDIYKSGPNLEYIWIQAQEKE